MPHTTLSATAHRSSVIEVKLSPKHELEWTKRKTALLVNNPFFAHLMMSQLPAVFTNDVPIAATDGLRQFYNPEKYFEFAIQEGVFVTCHEVMHYVWHHCPLVHGFRTLGYIPYADGTRLPYIDEIMQIAADLVINAFLIEAGVGRMPRNSGVVDQNLAVGSDAVIDVYRKLYKMTNGGKGGLKASGQGSDGHQPGGPNSKPFDIVMEPGSGSGKTPEQAKAERPEAEVKVAVQQAADLARAMGKMPAALDRMVKEWMAPKISWEEHIEALFARKIGTSGYTWRRADRRLITRDEPVFAPGRSGHGAECVVIVPDTSGSIGEKTLALFFGEMAGILEDVRPRRLIVMWCDAKVHRVDELEDASDLHALIPVGGGGTDFRPPFEEVEKMGLTPDVLVYLTDLYGSFPRHAPEYPVIWGAITNAEVPWGDVVRIPNADAD